MHISQISDARIENVNDVLKEGQMVNVLVQDIDNRGRIKKFTMKGVGSNHPTAILTDWKKASGKKC